MRNSVVLVSLIVLGICAYIERDRIFPPVQPEVAFVQPTPKPMQRPEPRLAPEGTFYMVDYVSTRTPRGIVGFERGREVRFVSADKTREILLVTDGQYQIEVNPAQLTNDMDLGELARLQDQASQSQLAAAIEQGHKQALIVQQKIDIERAKHVDGLDAGSTIGQSSRLDGKAERVGIWEPQYRNYYGYNYYGSPYYYLSR